MRLLVFGVFAVVIATATSEIATPHFRTLLPKGLEISLPDAPGISLVAFHYSINKRIQHVSSGEHNFDVRSKTGGRWLHVNNRVTVNPGDTVYYWVYVVRNGAGAHRVELSWKAYGHYQVGRVGCFGDAEKRHLDGIYLRDATVTPRNCIKRCKGWNYRYAGVQDHAECLCGNKIGTYPKYGDEHCQSVCTADQRYTCGGGWKVEIFKTGLEDTQTTQTTTTTKATAPTKKPTSIIFPTIGPGTTDPPVVATDKPAATRKPAIVTGTNCPHVQSGLTPWNPGNRAGDHIQIGRGKSFLLQSSASVYSIDIEMGGKLIFDDQPGKEIKLRTRYINVKLGGELHIGSETCRYQGKAVISLYGRANEGQENPVFGKKFIGVNPGAVLEMHGRQKMSWTLMTKSVPAGSKDPVIDLDEDASSWEVGDHVVLASTDHDMEQAEEFTIRPCTGCSRNQIALTGIAKYLHYGEISHGVDMRGEVGMLTQNIRVEGEMESACYNYEQFDLCQFFKQDTFGGHIMVLGGTKSVHFEGVELTKMGQQTLARYPFHFHLCDDATGMYVKSSSIHHVFNRCVTIHRTNNLLVKDTVGYDTLGHCYFLEDGGERFNVLDHNLGAVTRHGTVLPSDRNADMCRKITHNVWPGYKPHDGLCNGLSTFWIAHPNNTFINNAAAGADGVGYWFIMHGKLSGPSTGLLPDGHSGRSPIGRFYNNRAHGNSRIGIMIDFGVKDSDPTARFPQERFSMGGGLFMPHVDADTRKPREPAIIEKFICYKNRAGGWMRGGDIFVRDSQFADNHLGLTLSSSGSLPFDYGSHQEVTNSVFVGESDNHGTKSPNNRWWGSGYDGIGRSYGEPSFYTIGGFEIYDGPVMIEGCTFRKYVSSAGGKRSALKFKASPFMFTPHSYLEKNSFDSESLASLVSIPRGRSDGDRTAVLHDRDGSSTGYRNSYVFRDDNYLYKHEGCVDKPKWGATVCTGPRAINFYIVSNTPGVKATLYRDDYPNNGLLLDGLNHGPVQQHQFGVMSKRSYTLHWDRQTPGHVELNPYFADRGDWVRVGVCYPPGTTFTEVYYAVFSTTRHIEQNKRVLRRVYSLAQVDSGAGNDVYYWDGSARLLFVKVVPTADSTNWDHCSSIGCERVHIKANVPAGGSGDCRSSAYGIYRKNPTRINMAPAS